MRFWVFRGISHLAEDIQVQEFPLHVWEAQPGPLQLPELGDLVQEVELDSGQGLGAERSVVRRGLFRPPLTPQRRSHPLPPLHTFVGTLWRRMLLLQPAG